MDEKNSTIRYLYLCNSDKRIKDGSCNGFGCRIMNRCRYTTDEYYAKNDIKYRFFNYYLIPDENGFVEEYWEIEKES